MTKEELDLAAKIAKSQFHKRDLKDPNVLDDFIAEAQKVLVETDILRQAQQEEVINTKAFIASKIKKELVEWFYKDKQIAIPRTTKKRKGINLVQSQLDEILHLIKIDHNTSLFELKDDLKSYFKDEEYQIILFLMDNYTQEEIGVILNKSTSYINRKKQIIESILLEYFKHG